MSRVSNMHLNH